MNKIGERNAENYKNLTGFTDVFNEMYGTEKYYPVTESYSFMTRNVNDTIDWLNIFTFNNNWIES